jgi:hypothetical protein
MAESLVARYLNQTSGVKKKTQKVESRPSLSTTTRSHGEVTDKDGQLDFDLQGKELVAGDFRIPETK